MLRTEAIIVSRLLVLVLWQLSCLFSLTLYSSSILLNVSSDKRERDFSSAHKSGQHKVPHRAISQHWSSHRQATPKSHSRQENSLSALVCVFLKINQLNFHCRTAITGNSMFLENPSYWQVPRKLARTPTIITVRFKNGLWPYGVSQCWFITSPQHRQQILTSPVSPDFRRVRAHLPYRKKVGLTLMNEDLYFTPPNSVLEITEPGKSKRQPSVVKAFRLFSPHTYFLHTFSGKANFY